MIAPGGRPRQLDHTPTGGAVECCHTGRDLQRQERRTLAIKKSTSARENEIIVARIGDDVTVKRFHQHGSSVSLIAENDDYQPIEVDLQTEIFAIEGIVVGLIRRWC